jgi:hypothetical protein
MANAVGKRWVHGVVPYPGTEVIPLAAYLHALLVFWAAQSAQTCPKDQAIAVSAKAGFLGQAANGWKGALP